MARLLMGVEAVTLVKHKKTDNADGYVCYSMPGASWFASVSIVTAADGAKPANTYTVRVPSENMPTGIVPDLGDYVVRGVVTDVSRPADLKGTEHFRITAVGCNLRGNLPHWRVSGA